MSAITKNINNGILSVIIDGNEFKCLGQGDKLIYVDESILSDKKVTDLPLDVYFHFEIDEALNYYLELKGDGNIKISFIEVQNITREFKFKQIMESKMEVIKDMEKQYEINLDNYEEDGDDDVYPDEDKYILMSYSMTIKSEHMSEVFSFINKVLSEIDSATEQKIQESLADKQP